MRVFVYFNLHKKVWSIKALEGANRGRVIAHREIVILEDAKPRVSEAGRQRVIKEKRKNVHAGVVGYWDEERSADHNKAYDAYNVTYNPYKYRSFVYCNDTEKYWKGSDWVAMNSNVEPSKRVIVFDEGEWV